jgi:chromosome segregation ATPase
MSKFSEFNEDISNSNISFASTVNTSTSSSKAVLAALRALQEKIRRLEAEKTQAIDECQNLRNQMKIIEIDIDHVRQREVLSSQKLIQETHIEFEKVLSEKNQLEIRLNNLEEERILLQKSSEEMIFKLKCLEEDKSTYTIKLHDFESLQTQLQTHLVNLKQKEKELSLKMSTDLKEKEKNIEILNQRVKSASIELNKVKDEKASNEKRLIELDKLVRQLLATNEALVASNASFVAKDCVTSLPSSINNYKNSKNNHMRKSISLPNAVTKSTESTKAKIINKQSFEKS